MGIRERKNLKSIFLLAAIHAQTAPALFVGGLIGLANRRKPLDVDDFNNGIAEMAKDHAYARVPQDQPLYTVARSVAEKAGIELTDVYLDDRYSFYSAHVNSRKTHAAIFLRGDPMANTALGEAGYRNIIAHEMTHAVRRNVDNHISNFLGKTALTVVGLVSCCFAMAGSGVAGLLALVSTFSVFVGIPALERAWLRNEEHLADIGAGELTGDPQGLYQNFEVLQGIERDDDLPTAPEDSKGSLGYVVLSTFFGETHPSWDDRQRTLRRVFNLNAFGRLKAGSPTTHPQTSPDQTAL